MVTSHLKEPVGLNMADTETIQLKKLVRNNIPNAIRTSGYDPKYRVLKANERSAALAHKIVEEANELKEAIFAQSGEKDDILEEMSDVCEVLDALLVHLKLSQQELLRARHEKNSVKGNFSKFIFVDEIVKR